MTSEDTTVEDESNGQHTNPTPTTGEDLGGPRHDVAPFLAVAAGVREYLATDASGHDMHHVWRVFRLTQRFAEQFRDEWHGEA